MKQLFLVLILMFLYSLSVQSQEGNCGNAGFENGMPEGYETYIGSIDDDGTVIIATPGPDEDQHRIMNISEGIDPIAENNCTINDSLTVVPQGAGQYAMRLGNSDTGAEAERVLLKFTVTPDKTFFLLSYAVVLQDPGHEPFEQPRFELRILDENGDLLPCGEYQVRASENIEGFENCGSWRVRPWTTAGFELQSYLGQEIQIEILTTDCSRGGHAGYAYFDGSCQPLEIKLDGYCPGTTSASLIVTEGFEEYSWNTGDTTNAITIDNPQAGTEYSVTVTSATGCTLVLRDTLPEQEPQPVPSFTELNDTTICPGNSVWIKPEGENVSNAFSPTLGFAADSFQVSPVSTTSYLFTTADAYGCMSDTLVYHVTVDSMSSAIDVYTTNVDSVSCADGADGAIAVSSNAANHFWSTGDSTSMISGLEPGAYSVRMFDEYGCHLDQSIEVFAPPALNINLVDLVEVTCFGDNDGAILAAPSGGTPPYYNGSSGQEVDEVHLSALPSGDYTIEITDENGCGTAEIFTVPEPPDINLSGTTDSVRCNGESNGNAAVEAVGGVPPYSFAWDDPSNQTDPQAIELAAGTYNATVTDDNGCEKEISVTVEEPPVLAIQSAQADSTSCFGESDGSAQVTPTGGNAGYSYQWDDGLNQTTQLAGNLPTGTYMVSIEDAKGCSIEDTITVPSPAPLVLTAIQDSVTCFGGADGGIEVIPEGGNGGYQYAWGGGLPASSMVSNLPSASYTVTVTDQNGCTADLGLVLWQPDSIQLEITDQSFPDCDNEKPGTVTVSANGGNGAFGYLWETGSTTPTAASYNAGNYMLTVTDWKGCSTTEAFKINGLESAIEAEGPFLDEAFTLCEGERITLRAAANNAIRTYQWTSTERLPCDTCPANSLVPLASASYSLTVTDTKGCVDTATLYVPVSKFSSELQVDADFKEDQAICFGQEATIELLATPEATEVSWKPADAASCQDCSAILVRPSTTTRYEATVLHRNGCVSVAGTDIIVDRVHCAQYIPNAFSPNDDGTNDVFGIPSTLAVEKIDVFKVFDRYGGLVFDSQNVGIGLNQGWDGSVKGHTDPAAPGVYTYLILVTYFDGSKELFSGDVNLIR